MKSSEVIKKLQEIDPEGKYHVRFNSGELIKFDLLPGYYDGSYTYMSEDEKLVTTTKDTKIKACYLEPEDIVWNYNGDMDEIRERIDFDMHGDNNKKAWENIKKEAEKAREFHQRSLKQFTFEVLKQVKDGYTIIQPLDTKIGHYNEMKYIKDKEIINLKQGECGAVLKSGLFKRRKTTEHYIWEVDI